MGAMVGMGLGADTVGDMVGINVVGMCVAGGVGLEGDRVGSKLGDKELGGIVG
jgi:hypothetical protein